MKTIAFTYHLEEIDTVSKKVLDQLGSKLVLFKGEMGAGKTTLINSLLKTMKSDDKASSPTFSIVNEYKLANSEKVFHFDFYRIESIEEAYNFGVEDYLNSDAWIFVEWPDRILDILPNDAQTITIKTIDDTKRSLELTVKNEEVTNITL